MNRFKFKHFNVIQITIHQPFFLFCALTQFSMVLYFYLCARVSKNGVFINLEYIYGVIKGENIIVVTKIDLSHLIN